MCVTCGCDEPENDHDDDFNIKWSQLEDAAYAAESGIGAVISNIERNYRRLARRVTKSGDGVGDTSPTRQ